MSNSELIATQYAGITIEYNERENKWVFELRGRERKTDSLSAAKEAIDKPEPIKKAPFTKIPAYKYSYSDRSFTLVTITSVADFRGYSKTRPEVWVVIPQAGRVKVYADELYAVTEGNNKLTSYILAYNASIQELEDKRRMAFEAMTHPTLPEVENETSNG